MKKLLTSVAMALLLVGCAKEYDDSALKERIGALETRVTALESSIQSLQSAIGDGVFVAKVQELADPVTGKTVGVTVTYTTGDVKYFEISPKADFEGPVLGVIRSGSGALVWAVDGIAIEVAGQEVPVYQTPVFTLDEDGFLWVEVDGEKAKLGQVQNEGATLVDGIFTDIKVEQDKLVLTLSDGTTVNVPFAEAFKLNIETTAYTFGTLDPIEIPYTVSAKTANTVVGVAGYNPREFSVEVKADKIVVTPLSMKAAAVMLAYADSKIGLVSTESLVFEAEGLEVTDEPYSAEVDYMAEGEDASVTVNVVSNIDFEVKPVDEWIHLVSVKSQAFVITLKLDDNLTGEVREGTVNIVKAGTDEVVQTIVIAQLPAIIETGAVNLSKKGAANSYIVTEAGEYKFWAVKGNSGVEIDPASVEVLWETWNNAEEVAANSVIASVRISGSYVVFTTPETLKPGNAVIAAKDDAGVILWSWHIWVPATAIETNTYGLFNAALMDRNLGALVAATEAEAPVESFGLTYQWVRKDPFVGPKAVNSGSNATVAGKALEVAPAQITLEESVANPTLMGHKDNEDWLTAPDNTLWNNEAKSMYDPCPPGYRVPACDSEQPLWASDLSTVPGWGVDAEKYLFKMGEPAAVFPFAGYRDDYGVGSMTHAYDRAVIWSAQNENDVKGKMLNVRGTSTHARSSAPKARAGSVRCVVADETPILPPVEPDEPVGSVVDLSEAGTANSYLVTAAGDYKFKAVKGNGAEAVAAATAVVLWETANAADAPEAGSIIAEASFADGYVSFSTPETLKPGNAVIAAKDAGGNILWSWHIWVPATEVAILDGTALCGAKIMDRNLGALVATAATGDADPLSIGLFYQWGRKDPFPGIVSFSGNTGAGVAGEAWTAHGELVTTEYSVAHPTEYAHIKEVDPGVWNVDDPKDLWNTEDNKKTVYDPCPPGYRVPLYDKSLPMWSGSFGSEWTLTEANRFSFGDIVFPVGGYIDCWSPGYSKVGERTHIWAASWYDAERATCLYYRQGAYYAQKFHKAKAGSVRCVAE